MQYRKNLLVLLLLLAAASVAGLLQNKPGLPPTPSATASATPPAPAAPKPVKIPEVIGGTLKPLRNTVAPTLKRIVRARFQTTQGPLLVEIYPEAAPRAAARFQELIRLGFYDNTPIFRVEPGFVAQFGINSKMSSWKGRSFQDDPAFFRHSPGTLAFAKAGPDTNDTQIFINYNDNSQLVASGGFTAFAKITEGFEHTDHFKEVPEAGDQSALWEDTAGFLKTLTVKPDSIVSARIVK